MAANDKDPQEDIDHIMSEIESLQKEMTGIDKTTEAVVEAAAPEEVVAEAAVVPEEPIVEEAPVVEEAPMDVVAEAVTGMEEFHASSDDVSMEETLGELKEEAPASGKSLLDEIAPEVAVVEESVTEEPVAVAEAQDVVHEIEREIAQELAQEVSVQEVPEGDVMAADNSKEYETGGSLSMTLTGSMSLKLRYEYEGEEVTIGFSDHSLMVQMTDGTEFKIPVNRSKKKTTLKRVA